MLQMLHNITTPEGLFEAMNHMSNKLNELVSTRYKDSVPKKFCKHSAKRNIQVLGARNERLRSGGRCGDSISARSRRRGSIYKPISHKNTRILTRTCTTSSPGSWMVRPSYSEFNADIGTFAKERKSGTESYGSLVFKNEKKSTYTVVSVVEMIKTVDRTFQS